MKKREWCDNYPMECGCKRNGKCLNAINKLKKQKSIETILTTKYGQK